MNNNRILITGGSSLIAKKIAKRLILKGWKVQLISRRIPHNAVDNIDQRYGDIRDKEFLEVAAAEVEIIIHLAGVTHTNSINEYYEVNTEGTKNIIHAAHINDVKKIVFMSTRAAGNKSFAGDYGYSKLLGEEAIKDSGLNWTIFRPAEIYGIGYSNSMINRLVNYIKSRRIIPVIGGGNYLLSPVLDEDVADALVTSLETELSNFRIYVLAGPETITLHQVIDIIANFLQKKVLKIYLPIWFAKLCLVILSLQTKPNYVPDQIPRLVCLKDDNIDAAQQDLLYKPINLNLGLAKLIQN
jgi:NADH dehydrogenase